MVIGIAEGVARLEGQTHDGVVAGGNGGNLIELGGQRVFRGVGHVLRVSAEGSREAFYITAVGRGPGGVDVRGGLFTEIAAGVARTARRRRRGFMVMCLIVRIVVSLVIV